MNKTVTFPVLQGDDLKESNRRKQQRRQAQLEAMAKAAGWNGWSEFVTSLRNGDTVFPQRKGEKS
jgi:hypothetical protein